MTNEKMLLRIADISEYDKKKCEFKTMKRLAECGIPMSFPIDFGICNNGQNTSGTRRVLINFRKIHQPELCFYIFIPLLFESVKRIYSRIRLRGRKAISI
ncbi:hypothetical protein [Halalkalibacterium halodurans]|uniref:hypothetical protein n=1 Tax=Halalkalibacterium halodurans TaxID=86665 RepID=UPI00399C6888